MGASGALAASAVVPPPVGEGRAPLGDVGDAEGGLVQAAMPARTVTTTASRAHGRRRATVRSLI